jgi:NADH-quinone oxidoreductase subunit I
MTETATQGPIARYFATVWNAVFTTIAGLGVTGRYLLAKPVTLQYPDEKPEIPDGFRGIHVYEMDKCIACDLCSLACPVDCIYIESIGKGKNAVLTRYEIDYNRCIFCGLCVEPCPTDCIHMGKGYDYAQYASEACTVDFVQIRKSGQAASSPVGDTIQWAQQPPAQS